MRNSIKVLLTAAIFVFVMCAAYLLTAFTLWQADPKTWSEFARACTSFGGVLAAIYIAATPWIYGDDL